MTVLKLSNHPNVINPLILWLNYNSRDITLQVSEPVAYMTNPMLS